MLIYSGHFPVVCRLWNSQNTLTKLKIFFSRTTGPILTIFGKKHPLLKGIQEELFNTIKGDNGFFLLLKNVCIYCWFELFSQMSDVDHKPLVCLYFFLWLSTWIKKEMNLISFFNCMYWEKNQNDVASPPPPSKKIPGSTLAYDIYICNRLLWLF